MLGFGAVSAQAQLNPLPDFTQTAPVGKVSKEVAPRGAVRSPLFGINTVWGQNSNREGWENNPQTKRLVERIKEAGITHVRVIIHWSDIERERGKWDFQALEGQLRFLTRQGFKLTAMVEGTPAWAVVGGQETLALCRAKGVERVLSSMAPDAKYWDDFGRFATELAKRYKDILHQWECWSEPDGQGMPSLLRDASGKPIDIRLSGDVVAYTGLLKVFSSAMHRADPACKVAIGGLSVPNTRFLEGIYVNGGKEAFDAISVHPTLSGKTFDFAWIDACRSLLVTRNDLSKSFWVSEWGWNTYPAHPKGISEGEQARLVREALVGMRARPYIEQAYYQTLNDWREDEKNPLSIHSCGLCDQNLQPKRAYKVFQAVAFNTPAPLNRFRTIPILANVPPQYSDNAVSLTVDMNKGGAALPKMWRGMTPSGIRQGMPHGDWIKLANQLATDSTMVVRVAPLSEENAIEVNADGSFVLHEAVIDAVLMGVAQKGVSLLVSITPPPGITVQHWEEMVTQLLKRYAMQSKYRILRWELAATPEQARLLYPAFVRSLQREVPGSLLGCRLTSQSPLEGLDKFMESCVENGLPVHILGWRVTDSAEELGQTLINLRYRLSHSAWFRTTRLLPELTEESILKSGGAMPLVLRLIDYCPTDQPNELQSLLVEQSVLLQSSGELSTLQGGLTFLNRLAGTRLAAETESQGVQIIASRSVDSVHALLWREGAESSIRMIRLLLSGIDGGFTGKARAYRVKLFSHTDTETPLLVTDVPVGELDIPLLIDSTDVLFIEVKPITRPAFLVTTDLPRFAYKSGNALEGDVGIRNMLTKPKPFELVISTSLSRVAPMGSTPVSKGTLRPNVTRLIRYALPIPTVFRPTPAYVNFVMGKDSYSGVGFLVEPALVATLPNPVLDVPKAGANLDVPVRVRNEGLVPFLVTLHALNGKETTFSIPKGGALTQSISCKTLVADPGNYPLDVRVESLGDPVATLRPILRVPLLCRYTENPIRIDGNLGEWQNAERVEMARSGQIRNKEWGGVLDLSGHFALQWDTENLYLACEVQDDILYQPYANTELWRGDSVLVGISASRNALWDQIGYADGEHEFGMALLSGNKPTLQRFSGTPRENSPQPKIAVRRDGSRLYYEAAIPWSQLRPISPKPEALFGLGLLFSDEDGRGRGVLEWGSGLGEARRPGQFPSIRLVR